MIVSIGYRVNSKQVTKFRQWATKTLKPRIIEGYTINPNRIHKKYEALLVSNAFQSFGGKYVYENVEEKADHLLYFIVKNHPFSDGNKRNGTFAFVWFLRKAKTLNTNRITPEALTALILLVAKSDPKEKD